MELTLPFPPTPEYMARHAATLAELVLQVDGIELDYSVDSLQIVDRLLGRFHEAGDDPERPLIVGRSAVAERSQRGDRRSAGGVT